MKPVPLTDPARLQAALQRVKAGAPAFATNLFAEPNQLARWMGQGRMELLETTGAALILRRDPGFLRLCHLARNQAALAQALGLLPAAVPGRLLVTDLVGREVDLEALTETHAAAGFLPYQRLVRMAAPGPPPETAELGLTGVEFATIDEAAEVQRFLAGRQDPLAEQTPDEEELRGACAGREVLCCRRDGNLAGVLVMASTGYTATLRAWFVDRCWQRSGVGSSLIRRFFHCCAASRRIVLWVIADNEPAIAKYRHYGFTSDPLVDQVMVADLKEV